MAKLKKKEQPNPIQVELESLKRLMTLFLLKAGASQGEIAMALGVHQSEVSRMFSARRVKKFEVLK